MPACVASLLKVAVHAPIYGLVLAVPRSITRFPSAEASAALLHARAAIRVANAAVRRRMHISIEKVQRAKNATANPRPAPEVTPVGRVSLASVTHPSVAGRSGPLCDVLSPGTRFCTGSARAPVGARPPPDGVRKGRVVPIYN